MNLGVIHNEPIAEYHSSAAVSSTRLMDLRPCPLFYYMRHVAKTLPREDKKEFDIGNAAHWLILEGRSALESRTVLQPKTYPSNEGDKPWHNGATFCKDWVKACAGKVILTDGELVTIERMAASVAENPDAAALLSGGESEVTFRNQHPAFAVQCRADHWHRATAGRDAICADYKTCETIEHFRRDYFKLRYYYRAAFYTDIIEQVAGELPLFLFVVSEKRAPWRTEVFAPSDADIELGRTEMLADLKMLRQCFESGKWPGAKAGIQQIELTSWQRKLASDAGAALYMEDAA